MKLNKKIENKFGISNKTLNDFKKSEEDNWRKKLYNFFAKNEEELFANDKQIICTNCNNKEQKLVMFDPNKIINWEYRIQILYNVLNKKYDIKTAKSDKDNNLFCTSNFNKSEFIELFEQRENSKLYKKYENFIKVLKNRKKGKKND